MKRTYLLLVLTFILTNGLTAGENPAAVKYYLSPKNNKFIAINAGKDRGYQEGMIFNCYRNTAFTSAPIETGKIKLVETGESFSLAEVLKQGSEIAESYLDTYPGIMAGDYLAQPTYVIERAPEVIPTLLISYFDLFLEPKASPTTMELTQDGKEKLKELMEQNYSERKSGTLIIQSFTDRNGPSEVNQIESYQRALTVRQYLVETLGFDEDRTVAIGMGELEPIDQSQLPGYERHNRRIVFKFIPFEEK
jgi:hypothetical protein